MTQTRVVAPGRRSIVPRGRVVGLDMARCLALLAMMATHVLVAVDAGGVTVVQQVAGGRSSALFAVLAGVSMALMSGGRRPLADAERHVVASGLVVRALIITGIGLVLGALETGIAVILTYYGLLFLLGIPFLRLRARPLFLLAAGWVVVVPLLSHLVRQYLPEPSFANPQLESLSDPWQLLCELTFTGYYPVVPWLAYLFVGMAVGRLDLTKPRVALQLVGAGAFVAGVSWVASNVLLDLPGATAALARTFSGPRDVGSLGDNLTLGLATTPTDSWWWLAVRAPHSSTPFDLAHTIGCALVVIGLCLLVSRLAPRVIAVVFGAGAMTLTLYSLHVILRTPEIWPEDNVETYLRHVLLVLLVGALFRLRGLRGPLEWVVAKASGAAADSVRRTAT